MEGYERLLTTAEVAALFRVDPKTVLRWKDTGRLGSVPTPGGTPRYRESDVRALLDAPADGRPGTPPDLPSAGPVPVKRTGRARQEHRE